MPHIEIYTWQTCPWCQKAKALLDEKGVTYSEYKIDGDDAHAKMVERAGGRTSVPQIFIDNHHIGGCKDMFALDEEGGLDPLLKL